jgi:hypothetical protein
MLQEDLIDYILKLKMPGMLLIDNLLEDQQFVQKLLG